MPAPRAAADPARRRSRRVIPSGRRDNDRPLPRFMGKSRRMRRAGRSSGSDTVIVPLRLPQKYRNFTRPGESGCRIICGPSFSECFKNKSGATILLARAKRFPSLLPFLLSAFLAWPANLPVVSPAPAQPPTVVPSVGMRLAGPSFSRLDRESHLHQSEWSDVADNAEESDGRDGSCPGPLVLSHCPFELPSLIPSSPEGRPIDTVDTPVSFPRSPQLRC